MAGSGVTALEWNRQASRFSSETGWKPILHSLRRVARYTSGT
jgi:hypothetical protein